MEPDRLTGGRADRPKSTPRRRFIQAAGAALAALGLGAGVTKRVQAVDQPLLIGQVNTANPAEGTVLNTSVPEFFEGFSVINSGEGTAIAGHGRIGVSGVGPTGVHASGLSIGVDAFSSHGDAVVGSSVHGNGVVGSSSDGEAAVVGIGQFGAAGVLGRAQSENSIGVIARAENTAKTALKVEGAIELVTPTTDRARRGSESLQSRPVGFLVVTINRVNRKIPFYAV